MSTTHPGAERRTHVRHPLNFSVRFRAVNAQPANAPAEEAELAGTDLSLGGLGAVGSQESVGAHGLKPGLKMMLKLKLGEEEEELLVPAKVMWAAQRGQDPALHFAGLKFVFLSDEGLLRIQKFVVRAQHLQPKD